MGLDNSIIARCYLRQGGLVFIGVSWSVYVGETWSFTKKNPETKRIPQEMSAANSWQHRNNTTHVSLMKSYRSSSSRLQDIVAERRVCFAGHELRLVTRAQIGQTCNELGSVQRQKKTR